MNVRLALIERFWQHTSLRTSGFSHVRQMMMVSWTLGHWVHSISGGLVSEIVPILLACYERPCNWNALLACKALTRCSASSSDQPSASKISSVHQRQGMVILALTWPGLDLTTKMRFRVQSHSQTRQCRCRVQFGSDFGCQDGLMRHKEPMRHIMVPTMLMGHIKRVNMVLARSTCTTSHDQQNSVAGCA